MTDHSPPPTNPYAAPESRITLGDVADVEVRLREESRQTRGWAISLGVLEAVAAGAVLLVVLMTAVVMRFRLPAGSVLTLLWQLAFVAVGGATAMKCWHMAGLLRRYSRSGKPRVLFESLGVERSFWSLTIAGILLSLLPILVRVLFG